jgi:ribosomal protein S18 acetylase RimI-like enzyme
MTKNHNPDDDDDNPPDFTTERLRVWYTVLRPADCNLDREVFIACRNDIDRPMVTATCMVWGSWVDWIEVSSEYRRQGFAKELIRGIEKYLGQKLTLEGGSDPGDKFCEAMNDEESQPR